MHRTQILLESWQHQALKTMAEKEGRSLGELVRALLTQQLQRRRRNAKARLRAIEGLAEDREASGRDHDRYLYGKERRR